VRARNVSNICDRIDLVIRQTVSQSTYRKRTRRKKA